MQRFFLAAVLLTTPLALSSLQVQAQDSGDDIACLDCHVPAEDWEGMTPEEILTHAKDMSNKRHKDNSEFTDDQLKAMIAELLKDSAAK